MRKNTAFHSLDDATGALFPMQYDPSKSWSIKGENADSYIAFNAADSIFNVSGKIAGHARGNVGNVDVGSMLMDIDACDFRPIAGSIIDKSGAGAESQ